MTLLLQVCPIQPHNCHYHRHLQGHPNHQAQLSITQGHVLHLCDTVPLWNWCITIFPLPKQHGHKTPCPPNLLAYAKPWHCLNLRQQNLPACAQGFPLLTRETALQFWIRNLANYLSIANSEGTHTTIKFGTAPILMNSGVCAKELVWATRPAANKLQGPTHST
jgi:hypothetical protein